MFNKIFNLIIALMIFAVLFTALDASIEITHGKEESIPVTVKALAGPERGGIFTDYIFSFEVLSLLLLAALIGSLYIARKEA
jgi:NADH-quinone oxidoreductase subunit J